MKLVLAVVAKYFPSPTEQGPSGYCSDKVRFDEAVRDEESIIPAQLRDALKQTGRIPTAGDVKYIFLTKPGPGPLKQPLEESLLDPLTGNLKPPSDKHKRLQIAAPVKKPLTETSLMLARFDGFLIGTILTGALALFYFTKLRKN